MEHTSVLVVGGGLVGLSAAVFLAEHGVKTVVAERHVGLSEHPRARGLTRRTMELFASVGVADRLRATGSARSLAGNVGIEIRESLTGPALAPNRPGSGAGPDDVSPTGWCLCDQDDAEPVLAAHAVEHGASLRLATEVVELREVDDGVLARLQGADGETWLHAAYVIAADGASSPVRRRLSISSSGPGALSRSVSIRFDADLGAHLDGRRFVLCYVNNPTVRGVLAPIDNDRRWVLHVPCAADELPDLSAEHAARLVRAATGLSELAVSVRQTLPWTSAGRVADRFRVGRVFLAGDAAHVMPPTGAFGSSTGIQDVHNLAWRLAWVLSGRASTTLLDGYEQERRPTALATMEQAVLRSADRPRLGRAPHSGNSAAGHTAAGGAGEPGGGCAVQPDWVVELGYRYPTDDADFSWLGDPGLTVGARAPHAWLIDGDQQFSTLDLLPGRFTVLTGDPRWATAATDQAATVLVGADAPYLPADAAFFERYGLSDSGAVLVRPDGIVAWRSADGDGPAALSAALERLLDPTGLATRDCRQDSSAAVPLPGLRIR